jgi:hypothetical protein
MDGVIYDKYIHVTTTTTFDIGEVAPINTMSDSFRWYQAPIIVSLRNIGITKLDYASFRLKETFKETKTGAKTIYTHSKNFTLQCGAQVQGGFKTFTIHRKCKQNNKQWRNHCR